MKKKVVAFLLAILTVVFTMGLAIGCKGNKEKEISSLGLMRYHVESISPLPLIKWDFMYAEENRIAAMYPNKDYSVIDYYSQTHIELPYDKVDENGEPLPLPSSKVILLTEQEQLEEVFEKAPVVDLDTQMVMIVLIGFNGFDNLKNIKIENGTLEVIFEVESIGSKGYKGLPCLHTRIRKLDKMEITDTKVTMIEI